MAETGKHSCLGIRAEFRDAAKAFQSIWIGRPDLAYRVCLGQHRLWIPLTYFLARSYLSKVNDPDREGLRLGLIFSATNFILDLVVLLLLLKAGANYFAAASIWFAYLLLIIIPWLTGRSLQKALP